MNKNIEKPTSEAKALSLFLMAYKTKDPIYKEKSKRINRLFDLVKKGEFSREDYSAEIQKLLEAYGGYNAVIEKTIRYYIEKTGEWKSNGNDQYSQDANEIAKDIL